MKSTIPTNYTQKAIISLIISFKYLVNVKFPSLVAYFTENIK